MSRSEGPSRTSSLLRPGALRVFRALGLTAVAIGLFCSLSARGQQSELAVKAAYVFNLTKFVAWPDASERIVIGIIGGGPMAGTLRGLAGKISDSKEIVVLENPSEADLKRCAVVYVTYSSGKKIDEVLEKLTGRSVLTVGDAASFSRRGGMLTLLTVGDRIEIEVNLQACRQANLKISSKLLSLAKVVVTTRGAG